MKTLIFSFFVFGLVTLGTPVLHAEDGANTIEWFCLPTDKPTIAHASPSSCKDFSNSAFSKAGCSVNESKTVCKPETADDLKERNEGEENKRICKSQSFAFQDQDPTASKNTTSNREGQASGASAKEAKCMALLKSVHGWKCKTEAENCTSANFNKDTGKPECGDGEQVARVRQDLNTVDQSVPVAFCKKGGGGNGGPGKCSGCSVTGKGQP